MRKNDNHKVAACSCVGSTEQLADNRLTALYCRSAQTCDIAIETQERQLRQFAEENGYENLSCYIDNGASGVTLDRLSMNRLLSDIRSGIVKMVIVTRADRIARGADSMCRWAILLRGTDVECLTIDTGKEAIGNEFAFWRQALQHISPKLLDPKERPVYAADVYA